MARVTPIDKGHSFLFKVNTIFIQNHIHEKSVTRIIICKLNNHYVLLCGWMYSMKKRKGD